MPKRMRRMRSSRGVMLPRTRLTASRRSDWIAASRGWTASSSSIRSPRWPPSSSPIGVSRLIGSFAHLHRLAHLVERQAEALRKLLLGRLAPELLPHLPGQPPQPGGGLDHVHRNANRRRRVGDRAGDRLADPPGRIGRELEAPAVVELVHALHQPDIALLDQVQELEAPVPVPLGDRDHEPQVGLDHLLLGLARLPLALQNGAPAIRLSSTGSRPVSRAKRQDVSRVTRQPRALLPGERLPAFAAQPADPRQPGRLQLATLMLLQERLPPDAALGGQAQKRAFAASQAAVQLPELVHERLDAVIGELKACIDAARSRFNSRQRLLCHPVSVRFLRASSMRCAWSRRSFP